MKALTGIIAATVIAVAGSTIAAPALAGPPQFDQLPRASTDPFFVHPGFGGAAFDERVAITKVGAFRGRGFRGRGFRGHGFRGHGFRGRGFRNRGFGFRERGFRGRGFGFKKGFGFGKGFGFRKGFKSF